MKKIITFCIFTFLLSTLGYSQSVDMIKNFIKQFSEETSKKHEKDNIDPKSSTFAPLSESITADTYTSSLNNIDAMFSIDELNSSYTLLGDKEYPINNLKVICNYTNLPGFNVLNTWLEITGVEDLNKKSLWLAEDVLNKYYELGIVGDDYNFTIPGEASQKIWLNRKLEWKEEFTITGKLNVEYPTDYAIAIFSTEDLMKKKTIDGMEFQLVEIKDNMVTYTVSGNRRDIQKVKVILLNKEDKPFLSTSSIGIDGDYFNPETKVVKTLTDEEIQKSIDNFDYSNYNIYQVKKVKVEGTVSKVVFLKINNTAPISKEFSTTLEYYQEF